MQYRLLKRHGEVSAAKSLSNLRGILSGPGDLDRSSSLRRLVIPAIVITIGIITKI